MQTFIEQLARDAGISDHTIWGWRRNGRVAHRHRLDLATAAKRQGVELTAAHFDDFDLVRGHKRSAGVPAEAAERACDPRMPQSRAASRA